MIKKILIFISFFFIIQVSFANNYVNLNLDWYNLKYIKYDTKSKDFIFKIASNPDYEASSLRNLMEKNNWISAINGVFFCPSDYKACWWKDYTSHEKYIKWEKIWYDSSTWDRVVFAIDKRNKPFLFQTDKINPDEEKNIYYWFANFPLLLLDKVNKFYEYETLWLVDSKMKISLPRNFICSDETNTYIYFGYTSKIKLEDLPNLLLKIWCNNALNLDAGGSSSMIYNSKDIMKASRNILDWVVLERKNLDTRKIRELVSNYLSKFKNKIKDKSQEEAKKHIEYKIKLLSNTKEYIYNKNSVDISDPDTWEIIWYEININDIKTLSKLYFINYLNYNLNNL